MSTPTGAFNGDNITLSRIKDLAAIFTVAADTMNRLVDKTTNGDLGPEEAAAIINETFTTMAAANQP